MKIASSAAASPASEPRYLLARAHDVTVFERDRAPAGTRTRSPHDGLALDTGFLVHNDAQLPAARPPASRELGVAHAGVGDVVLGRLRAPAGSSTPAGGRSRSGGTSCEPALPRCSWEIGRWLRTARRSLDEADYEQHSLGRYLDEHGYSRRFRRPLPRPADVGALVDRARAARSSSRPPTRSASSTTTACSASGASAGGRCAAAPTRTSTRARRPARRRACTSASAPARSGATPDGVELTHRRRRAPPLRQGRRRDARRPGAARCSRTRATTSGARSAPSATPANDAVLHTDARLLPRARSARAPPGTHCDCGDDGRPTVTYSLNRLQALDAERRLLRDAEPRRASTPST